MKDFSLEKNEEILATFSEVLIRLNENSFKLSVVLTNNRIFLLRDTSKELLMNSFLNSKLVDILSGIEIKLIIPLNEIKELKYINDTNKITFKDSNNEIDIKCANFKSYRIKLD